MTVMRLVPQVYRASAILNGGNAAATSASALEY